MRDKFRQMAVQDPSFRSVDVAARIVPSSASWPTGEDGEYLHWQRMRAVVSEARDRLGKFHEATAEIESDPRLTPHGKKEEHRKAAEKALSGFAKSPTLSRAQQTVNDLLSKWTGMVKLKVAANESEAVLHGEVRKHVASLEGVARLAFFEEHGADPTVAASLLEGPAFLSKLSDAEAATLRSKIEQGQLPAGIAEAKPVVRQAIVDSEQGWQRAQELIAEDVGLSRNADGSWLQPAEADAA